MRSYKILSKQKYSMGEYSIVPIRTQDRYDIMKWRNEQLYHLRQAQPLTNQDQDFYFDNVVAKLFVQEQPVQLLFSYLQNGVCIGYGGLVHINWIDKNAEISFIMNTILEKRNFKFHWRTYLELIEQIGFLDLKLHKLYVYAFDLRPHLYTALENSNYFKDAILKEHTLFNDNFIDIIIYSKLNK